MTNVRRVLSSPDQQLDRSSRDLMEARFGYDLSRVRIHTDAEAAKSARAVNSLAYTVGNHVLFGGGRYDPSTREGGRLLAHELAHVVQQDAIDAVPPDPSDKWWESLASADAGLIDRRLDEAARRTPITVNQCALSPLKNIEASRDSPMALPLGVAIPTVIGGDQVWFQVGVGVTRPFRLDPLTDVSPVDERGGAPVAGAQIVGRF